jgi:hypothetical protein
VLKKATCYGRTFVEATELSVREIIFAVSLLLLALGGLSGVVLFFWSIVSEKVEASWGVQTLWGLFLFGLIAGLILLAISAAK